MNESRNKIDQENQASETERESAEPDREAEILAFLVGRLAALNGMSASEIDVDKSFSYYGLDSVAAVGLAGEIEDWLEERLSTSVLFSLLFSRPSVKDLAHYLAKLERQ